MENVNATNNDYIKNMTEEEFVQYIERCDENIRECEKTLATLEETE